MTVSTFVSACHLPTLQEFLYYQVREQYEFFAAVSRRKCSEPSASGWKGDPFSRFGGAKSKSANPFDDEDDDDDDLVYEDVEDI